MVPQWEFMHFKLRISLGNNVYHTMELICVSFHSGGVNLLQTKKSRWTSWVGGWAGVGVMQDIFGLNLTYIEKFCIVFV